MTVKDASRLLGMHIQNVYALIYSGKLKATMRDGEYTLDSREVAAYKERRDTRKATRKVVA